MGKRDTRRGLTRKELLESAALATPAAAVLGAGGRAKARGITPGPTTGEPFAGMNVLTFLTDHERAIQPRTRVQEEQMRRLKGKLARVQRSRLQPLPDA